MNRLSSVLLALLLVATSVSAAENVTTIVVPRTLTSTHLQATMINEHATTVMTMYIYTVAQSSPFKHIVYASPFGKASVAGETYCVVGTAVKLRNNSTICLW